MSARSFMVAVGLLAWTPSARAELLDEAYVVRRIRQVDTTLAEARQTAETAVSREATSGLAPNPSLAWEREHLPGSPREAEDTLSVTLPLDLSGKRGSERALARTYTAIARAARSATQTDAVKRALNILYAALAAKQRAALLRRNVAELAEATRVLAQRREAGTASGFEVQRLMLEAELAKSELEVATARADAKKRELTVLLQLPRGQHEVVGRLTLSAEAKQLASVNDQLPDKPSLAFSRAALSEARAARQDAESAWIPTVAVSAGVKRAANTDVRYGYVAGLSLELPIFSAGQTQKQEALAEERLAGARLRSIEQATRLETARAAATLKLASEELQRLREATHDRLQRLERAALSAYREGEHGVVELLDAQRARTTLELRLLHLALMAKHAEVALRAARGEFE